MTYPAVIQSETRALEAEAQARLAHERRAARAPKCTTDRWPRLGQWLPLPRPGARAAERTPLITLTPTDCEQ